MELLGIGLEVVEGGHLLPVEVQGVVPLDHLVDAVHILHDEAGACRVEGATTEGHHRLIIPDEVEDRGEQVGLGGEVLRIAADEFASWVEDDDGYAEGTRRVLVLGQRTWYGVVSDDHEEGIVIPRLLARRLEELPQRHIRVGYGLVHRDRTLG